MKISYYGLNLIKDFEGLRLDAYADNVNRWAIGYGHSGLMNCKIVSKGMRVTEKEAEELLLSDLRVVEETINKNVKVNLTQWQFDALCSLIFNIGITAFKRSELLKCLNRGEIMEAADKFLSWKNAGDKNGLLLNRRKKERELFLCNTKS